MYMFIYTADCMYCPWTMYFIHVICNQTRVFPIIRHVTAVTLVYSTDVRLVFEDNELHVVGGLQYIGPTMTLIIHYTLSALWRIHYHRRRCFEINSA